MQAASRESLADLEKRFNAATTGLSADALTQLGDDLTAVAGLLNREVALRKHLTAGGDESAQQRAALAQRLLSGRIGAAALDVVSAAAELRWSRSRDLVNAIERFAHLAVIVDAERAGELDALEDELFRFSRVLDATPRLTTLLSDTNVAAADRARLLHDVLGSQAGARTTRALDQALTLLQSQAYDGVVAGLAELAAARRGEAVAHVTAAAELSSGQSARLARVLSSIYNRPISVQLEIDPEVLGGLSITIGDEVIDGTIASRLASAASHIAR